MGWGIWARWVILGKWAMGISDLKIPIYPAVNGSPRAPSPNRPANPTWVLVQINALIEALETQFDTIEETISTLQLANAAKTRVVGEIPQGDINGSNATFQSSKNFTPETVEVFINGLRQTLVTDYLTTGNRTISFSFSPLPGESVVINYIEV